MNENEGEGMGKGKQSIWITRFSSVRREIQPIQLKRRFSANLEDCELESNVIRLS